MMKSYCILNYLCYLVPYRSDLGCMQGYIEVFKRIEEQSCKTYWRYSSTWSSFSCSFYFLPVPTPFWESLRANLEIQDLDFLQNLIPQGWSSSCVHWVFPLKEFKKRKVSKGRFFHSGQNEHWSTVFEKPKQVSFSMSIRQDDWATVNNFKKKPKI